MSEITLLTQECEDTYADMLQHCQEAIFTHSIQYRNLLADFLRCQPYYIIALEGKEVVGALPAFLKENPKHGNVLNSLPFFGSHGGVLVRSDYDDGNKMRIKKLLIDRFTSLAVEENCILSTIITSPFDFDISFYETNLQYRFKDSRVAQIVEFGENITDAEHEIMYRIVEPDNRRAIRRPLKHGITLEYSKDFRPLFDMHQENISTKGGNVQPLSFLEKISESMDENQCSLTYAKKGDIIIAGLLLFFFRNTVNYLIPGFRYEYAVEQGTSFLIYQTMKRAITEGFKYWNFGGTSESQPSLYRFKARWGTKDHPYYYYVLQHDDISHILKMRPGGNTARVPVVLCTTV